MPRIVTPWYYGWNVVAIGMIFQAVLFGTTFFAFTMWVGPWMEEFDVKRAYIMYGFLALGLVQSFVSPFAGRAMDKFSIRGLVCGGATAAAIGFLLISQASAFWQIAIVYGTLITMGVLLGGPLAAQTLAAKWFRGRRGIAIGLSTVGTSLGGLVLVPVVTSLYLAYGWRTAHIILAASIVAIILPLVWTFVRNTPEDLDIEPDPESVHNPAHGPVTVFPQWTTKTILTNRNFWVMILAFTPMVTAFGGIQQNFAPYVADLDISEQDTGWLISIFSGTMICGKIFFGFMADRWDHRVLYGIAASVLCATMLLMMTSPDFSILLIVASMLGIAAGGFLPLLGAIVGSRFGPRDFGRVMGLLGPFVAISTFGPLIAATIRDDFGSYDLFLQGSLMIMIPAAVAMFFLKTLKKPKIGEAAPAAGE